MRWLYRRAIKFIVQQHKLWLRTNGKKGIRLTFEGAYIPQANFQACDMGDSTFTGANLRSSTFKRANVQKACFEEANFSLANFTRADFFKADMTEANLRGLRLNIHVNNRQKDDLEAMQKQAEKLWTHVEAMKRYITSPKELGEFEHDL